MCWVVVRMNERTEELSEVAAGLLWREARPHAEKLQAIVPGGLGIRYVVLTSQEWHVQSLRAQRRSGQSL